MDGKTIRINALQAHALSELAEEEDLSITQFETPWTDDDILVVTRRPSDRLTGATFLVDIRGGYHKLPPRDR